MDRANRADRLAWFVSRARNRNFPNARSVVDEFGVSLDTAKRDIRHLRADIGAPITYMPAQRGYRLSQSDWRLQQQTGNGAEVVAVASARQLLDGLSPALATEFERAVTADDRFRAALKLEAALMVTSTHAARRGAQLLPRLLEACVLRRRLRLRFESPWQDSEASVRVVSPWLVQLHDDHLYLHGLCHAAAEHRCFPLSGIVEVQTESAPAKHEPRGFRLKLQRGLGVGGGTARRADIRLYGAWARYVAHEVWHPGQRDRWTQAGSSHRVLKRELTYFFEQELVRHLLRGGGDVEVRTPLSLRRALRSAFAAGAARNGPDGRAKSASAVDPDRGFAAND